MENQTVKDRIANAYIKLLEQKKYSDITIVDIVNTAEAGRISFYRNFQNADDILRYYIIRETDKWLTQTDENYLTLTQSDLKPYIVFLLTHMYEYRHITDILMREGKMYLMEEEFDRRFFARLMEHESVWQIVYEVGGIYKLFYYWAKNGYKETPQEIAELVTK